MSLTRLAAVLSSCFPSTLFCECWTESQNKWWPWTDNWTNSHWRSRLWTQLCLGTGWLVPTWGGPRTWILFHAEVHSRAHRCPAYCSFLGSVQHWGRPFWVHTTSTRFPGKTGACRSCRLTSRCRFRCGTYTTRWIPRLRRTTWYRKSCCRRPIDPQECAQASTNGIRPTFFSPSEGLTWICG